MNVLRGERRSIQLLAGCGGLALLLSCACYAVTGAVYWRFGSMSPHKVAVEGDCPADEVSAFLNRRDTSLESVLERVIPSEPPSGDDEQKMALLREVKDDLQAEQELLSHVEVPPCAQGVLEQEVVVLDVFIQTIDKMEACGRRHSISDPICMVPSLFQFTWKLSEFEALSEGYLKLSEVAGVELPESLEPEDGGEDGDLGR